MRFRILKLCTLLMFFSAIDCFCGDFQEISKGFLTIYGSRGKYALAAVVDFGDGQLYAVTSQSVFLSGIFSFKLRDFYGNTIKARRMDLATNRDLIRFQIEKNDFIKPFKVQGKAKYIYEMNTLVGVVTRKAFNQKSLTVPGSLILSSDGIVGFASVITGYEKAGQLTAALAAIDDQIKWQKTNFTKFITQCRSLQEMRNKTLSLERIVHFNKEHGFMEFQPEFSESHIGWVKRHNTQYESYLLNPHKVGKSMGAAKLQHESRCNYYAGLRAISIFASNVTKNTKITRWYSMFLKKTAGLLWKRNKAIDDQTKSQMKQMVKEHPATKAKL